jgi:membrane associated rhomboid family serine protease
MKKSNIHLIGDEDEDENNSNNKTEIFSKIVYKGDPRKQSLLSYLKEVICPFFQFKSFSFIILVINFIVFIISLIPNGLEPSQKGIKFLPPSFKTLDLFGSLCGIKIRESFFQSYRWIANGVLHANFEHLFSNSLGILFFGTMIEYLIGSLKYSLIYILSGILGSLFTVLIQNNTTSVGASISCFGILGTLLGFYVINWGSLTVIFGVNNKFLIVFFPIMMIFLSLTILSAYESEINIYGHLGGMIFGFFLSFCFIKPQKNTDVCVFNQKVLFISGLVICISFSLVGFICFYTLDYYRSQSQIINF